MKVKIFTSSDPNALEEQMTEFLKNATLVGVEYEVVPSSPTNHGSTIYSALVIYNEK